VKTTKNKATPKKEKEVLAFFSLLASLSHFVCRIVILFRLSVCFIKHVVFVHFIHCSLQIKGNNQVQPSTPTTTIATTQQAATTPINRNNTEPLSYDLIFTNNYSSIY